MSEETKPAARPGYKTSEFWLSTASQVLGILYASGAIGDGGTVEKIAGLAAAALGALGYAVSRGMAKAKA